VIVKALSIFATSDLKISLGVGDTADIADEIANKLIAAGLVEAYEETHPDGEVEITRNGTVDVSRYKTANVKCGQYSVTYDADNTEKETKVVMVVKGDSLELITNDNFADNFTMPDQKKLKGWTTVKGNEEGSVESPYTPTENVNLYALYEDAED
jgi:hypothetical protein